MARADLLLNLVKAGVRGDQVQFRKTVEALAAEERAKNHMVLADRLLALLQVNGNGHAKVPQPIQNRTSSSAPVVEMVPRRSLTELILPPHVKNIIQQMIEEQLRADLLRSYNLEPRNRILLVGPPGNGKTTLAEAIADTLNVPILSVRYESVIGSYLGETAQRISQVFDYARTRECVLFFDEFDAIGKERGDLHETGEIKRVVSSLLLQIDALPSYVVVVTASNHPELLDRAVWRRFQIRLELPMPDASQIGQWLARFEKRSGQTLGLPLEYLSERLAGLSFSEVEDFATDVTRRIVLNRPGSNPRQITEQCLLQWDQRFRLGSQ